MKDLSHIFLLSDLDGTLLSDDLIIPKRNIDAIERFVKQGGHFAIATGRGYIAAVEFAMQLPINAPSIHFNGGNLYDYSKEEELWAAYLPPAAKGYVQQILDRYPYISASVLIGDRYYEITEPKKISAFATDGIMPVKAKLDGLPNQWYKVIFSVPHGRLDEIESFANSLNAQDVRFTTSTSFYLELLCREVSKGSALKMMHSFFDFSGKTVVAIGDYYNDIEMLQEADFSASPSSGREEVKELADVVVSDNNAGAVASLVEYIEANMSK